MFLISYLAHEDQYITAVQERLSLAKPPMAMVIARALPDVISQAQTLPLHAVIVDLTWPRDLWVKLLADLQMYPTLPLVALSPTDSNTHWWEMATELLRLDERPELFLHKLERSCQVSRTRPVLAETALPASSMPPPPGPISAFQAQPGLLENTQFRQFAEIFSRLDEEALLTSFLAWVQQACQASRAVLLLRDPQNGNFECRAHRGLPSSLIPLCRFQQTAPLCNWLASTGRILLNEAEGEPLGQDVLHGLSLLQAVVAIPMVLDGQLIGIIGLGPRLVGRSYTFHELEALFTLGGHVALTVHHTREHFETRALQELNEHMLSVMPTGTIVLGDDQQIAFVNAPAGRLLGKSRKSLQGTDLRSLPSPLGDLAYAALLSRQNLPRRELTLATTGLPVAVTSFALGTTPPSSMLLLEDLSAVKQLEQERERRVDLEVVTNLVHYLAHELRNPLVALSTFGNLVPDHADDPDFREFCESVLQPEIGRVNLILEQLLVLTNHAEFQFSTVDMGALFEHVTSTEDMRAAVVMSVPISLPALYGDAHRLETALLCILRTAMHFSFQSTPTTVRVELADGEIRVHIEVAAAPDLDLALLLNPWKQLMEGSDEQVDFGLATAQYIIEQHQGTLNVSVENHILTIISRLPIRTGVDDREEESHGATESARR
ncbi:MAG TPA: GAF domain-containing protein [Armatimonadota bacterium]|jgi:nitrogen-specific signal transduction histidine kinase